eukprot:366149-Chlamydomonas_euryale.AAC.7
MSEVELCSRFRTCDRVVKLYAASGLSAAATAAAPVDGLRRLHTATAETTGGGGGDGGGGSGGCRSSGRHIAATETTAAAETTVDGGGNSGGGSDVGRIGGHGDNGGRIRAGDRASSSGVHAMLQATDNSCGGDCCGPCDGERGDNISGCTNTCTSTAPQAAQYCGSISGISSAGANSIGGGKDSNRIGWDDSRTVAALQACGCTSGSAGGTSGGTSGGLGSGSTVVSGSAGGQDGSCGGASLLLPAAGVDAAIAAAMPAGADPDASVATAALGRVKTAPAVGLADADAAGGGRGALPPAAHTAAAAGPAAQASSGSVATAAAAAVAAAAASERPAVGGPFAAHAAQAAATPAADASGQAESKTARYYSLVQPQRRQRRQHQVWRGVEESAACVWARAGRQVDGVEGGVRAIRSCAHHGAGRGRQPCRPNSHSWRTADGAAGSGHGEQTACGARGRGAWNPPVKIGVRNERRLEQTACKNRGESVNLEIAHRRQGLTKQTACGGGHV